MEQWKDVVGYEGLYLVSNMGQIKALDRLIVWDDKIHGVLNVHCVKKGKILKGYPTHNNYIRVRLSTKKSETKSITVHRIVAAAFVPNPDNKPQVNHKDGDKRNNAASNLEWCTQSENQLHAFSTGLQIAKNNKHPFKKTVSVYKDGVFLKEYFGVRAMCEELGLDRRSVLRVLDGTFASTKGHTFKVA